MPQVPMRAMVHNGQDGLQRFKCLDGGATFNIVNGRPLARMQHRAKWLQLAEVIKAGLSVRKVAARMHAH